MSSSNSVLTHNLAWLGLALISYLAIGVLSIQFVLVPYKFAVVWPLSGVFLSTLILCNSKMRPSFIGLLFLAQLVMGYFGLGLAMSVVYALALTTEATLSWWILHSLFRKDFKFSTVRQTLSFIFFSVIAVNAVATSLAMLGIYLVEGTPFWDGWIQWWSSAAVGNLLVTPLIIGWVRLKWPSSTKVKKLVGELLVMIVAIVALSYLAFSVVDFDFSGLENPLSEALYFLTFPILIWAAFRHGIRGATVASVSLALTVFILSIQAIYVDGLSELDMLNVMKMQVFIAVISSTSLILAVMVSERKHAEQELKQIEGKYRSLIENLAEGITIINANGEITYQSLAAEQIAGYSSQELIGESVLELIHPEERDSFAGIMQEVLEAPGKSFSAQYQVHHKKGFYIWAAGTIVNRLHDKNVQGFVINYRDISDQKEAEEKLLEASNLINDVFDNVPFPMDIVGKNGEVLFMNSRMEQLVGKHKPGRRCWDLYTDDKKQCKDCPLYGEIQIGEVTSIEVQRVFGGKAYEIVHVGLMYKGEKATMETFIDITEKKEREQQLRKLSRAIEQSPVSVVITGLNGNINYVNPKFERLTGYSSEEVMGENPRILKSGKTDAAGYKNLWETIRSGKVWTGELQNKKKDGTLYWESASIGPIINEEGKITDYLAVKEDITEIKKTKDKLADALKFMEERVKERTAELQTVTDKLADANRDFMSSLEYAKRLQVAMTPSDAELRSTFKDVFTINLPKDVISGDFYWYVKKDKKAILAVVDCTGHGVPGALLGMAGNEALKHIVEQNGIISPDSILEKLDVSMTKMLNRGNDVTAMKDGMDMSLLQVDRTLHVVSYAGAKGHALYVKKDAHQSLVPDRFGIGGINDSEVKTFTQQQFNYEEGDRFYLFSDGFYDQFGGPKSKKLMRKKLVELVVSSAHLSMQAQHQFLLTQFNDWKGEEPQIDDVTMVGVEL